MQRTLAFMLLALLVPAAQAAELERQEFISDPDITRYGYDFKEGVDGNGGDEFAGIYDFVADDNNFDFLAKALEGKKIYRTTYCVKAQSELATSGFAVFLGQADSVPSSATQGNGKYTGAFANGVKVWMKEQDNSWRFELRQVVDQDESTLSAHTVTGTPHDARTFVFEANAYTGQMVVKDNANNVLLETEFSSDLDGAWHSQWFVGFGFGDLDAYTRLEDPDDCALSTQVMDLDPRAPELDEEPAQTPQLVGSGQAVTVSVPVLDDWDDGAELDVRLHWTLNGEVQTPKVMAHSAGTYTAQLPGNAAGRVVTYQVHVIDSSDLSATSHTYRYTVGNGEPRQDLGADGAGGGGGTFLGASSQNSFLASLAIACIGLFLFILTRRNLKLAVPLLLGSFVVAGVVFVSARFGPAIADAVASIPTWAWGLLAAAVVIVAVRLYARRRK